jgi:iron complex outermembrane receptor protein
MKTIVPSCPAVALLPRIAAVLGVSLLSATLLAQSAPPEAPAGELIELSPFTVRDENNRGYSSANSLGASRVNIPLINTPTTVVVLNEEFLRDLAVLDNLDAFRYVSGMNENSLAYNGQVTVRGFQAGDGVAYKDGLPDNITVGGGAMNDFAIIDRVEVIKGPNGVLYGSHAPGGVVNQITKKPLFSWRSEIKATAGSWNLIRGEIDTTGPLIPGKLAFRLVGMRQEGETYNHGPHNKLLVAPSLTWLPGNKTKVTVSFLHYVPVIGTSRTPWFSDRSGAVSTFLSPRTYFDEDDEQRKHWVYDTDVSIEHVFNVNWQARVVARATYVDEDKFNYNHVTYRFVGANNAALLTPTGAAATFLNYTFAEAFANPNYRDILIDRVRRRDIIEAERLGLYGDLVGNLDLGPTKHKLITSLQLTDSTLDNKQQLWNYPATSVISPVYVSNPLTLATNFRENTNTIAWNKGHAIGVQDNVSAFQERLHLVLGARYDSVHSKTLNRRNNARTDETKSEWSKRVGGLYKVTDGFSVFANWSQTFIPLSGLNALGTPFKNQLGEVKEAGFKIDLMKGRLTGTFSAFDLKLDNAVRQVLIDVSIGLVGQLQTGATTSKGYEMDWAWQPTDEVTLVASLGDLTSEDENGIATRGISQGLNWKLFGKYTFTKDRLKGLTLGAGYVYNNRAAGDGNASFFLPAYGLWDGFVAYARDKWRVQLNVTNLADELYVAGAVSNQFVSAGRPREYRLTYSQRF